MLAKRILSYQVYNDTESATYLANHYPKGKLFGKRHDGRSFLYKFILSMSLTIRIYTGLVYRYIRNLDIGQADDLLLEWEASVRIPGVIPRTDTLDQRRAAVRRLISKVPVYNKIGTVGGTETTYQDFLRTMSGIDDLEVVTRADTSDATGIIQDHFVFLVRIPSRLISENIFPVAFPVIFSTGVIPLGLRDQLDSIMLRVIPSFCFWDYRILTV